MSSKREVVNSKPRRSYRNSSPGEIDRLREEVNRKNADIKSLEDFVHEMQAQLCCSVCTGLLYQPFSLECGHVFCYSCILNWFKKSKKCPTCRQLVMEKPSVAYLIKEMVNSIVKRAEIVDPEETGERFNKEKQEADETVREHKGDLFPSFFLRCIRFPAYLLEQEFDLNSEVDDDEDEEDEDNSSIESRDERDEMSVDDLEDSITYSNFDEMDTED